MTNKTAKGLVEFAKSKIGVHYVYGAKGEILTKTKIYSWARQYPNIYTQAYINKALRWVGEEAVDCSGLISWYTGIIRGSSQFEQTGNSKISPSKLTDDKSGYAVWKQGHIGIVLDHNHVIEAKGINYGVIESQLGSTPWTKAFKIKDIKYTNTITNYKNGFDKMNGIWYYFRNGKMVTNAWVNENNRWYVMDGEGKLIINQWFYEDGKWYYLAGDGGMISNQWLEYKDNWYYFDGVGVCLTDTWYKYHDKWYYLDDTGTMRKGLIKSNDKWYYLDENGKLVNDADIIFKADINGALKFAGLVNDFEN